MPVEERTDSARVWQSVSPESHGVTRVSVCMTTYNCVLHVQEQLDSILDQITMNDEVVICDDGSSDGTYELLANYSDARIRLYRNHERLGHVQNFSKAIALACGEFIALSDHDDVWVAKRLERMLSELRRFPRRVLLVGEFINVDNDTNVLPMPKLGASPSNMVMQLIKIFLGKAKYFGCTFIFRQELKKFCIPIPQKIEAHDIWISMNACIHGGIVHLQENTLLHRTHGGNLTPRSRRGLYVIARSRFMYFLHLFVLTRRT